MLNAHCIKTEKTALEGLFKSVGYLGDEFMPTGVHDVSMSKLPPLLRTLIVTDGTVTKTLESYYWEHVHVDVLNQEIIHSDMPIERLQATAGDEIVSRDVQLRGDKSGKVYAFASSIILSDAIPGNLRSKLVDKVIGIGVLIRDAGLESYRQLIDVGSIKKMTYLHADEIKAPRLLELVYRTYRISLEGRPAILITEWFPLELYR